MSSQVDVQTVDWFLHFFPLRGTSMIYGYTTLRYRRYILVDSCSRLNSLFSFCENIQKWTSSFERFFLFTKEVCMPLWFKSVDIQNNRLNRLFFVPRKKFSIFLFLFFYQEVHETGSKVKRTVVFFFFSSASEMPRFPYPVFPSPFCRSLGLVHNVRVATGVGRTPREKEPQLHEPVLGPLQLLFGGKQD